MLFAQSQRLEDMLVRTLAEQPNLAAQALGARIHKDGKPYSRRAIFKELDKLQEQGVVIKTQGKYNLRIGWAVELQSLAEKIYLASITEPQIASVLATNEAKTSLHCSDLRRLDDHWIQMAMLLYQHTGKSTMFYWIRHSWFHLAHPPKEDQFQRSMHKYNRKLYMSIGGDTFLDRLPAPTWSREIYPHSFAPGPFAQAKYASIATVGDYSITLRIDWKLNAKIEEVYSKVRTHRQLTMEIIHDLFAMRGRCSLTLEHDPQKALTLRRRFCSFFAVDESTV